MSKEFINLHIGNRPGRALVGPSIEQGSSRVGCSVRNWVDKYVNLLQQKV